MTDERNKVATDPRPAYEPPRVLRLGGTNAGSGLCAPSGSADHLSCIAGGGAEYCEDAGNSAYTCASGGTADA